MNLIDKLCIEVADSDVYRNRRLRNTRAQSKNQTGSYYINDDFEEHNKIVNWFNRFDDNNSFFIDVEKTLQYLTLVEDVLLPNSNLFVDELSDFYTDVMEFKRLANNRKLVQITNMHLTGDSNRYLRFNNQEEIIKVFRKLICGYITNIIITKDNNNFFVWLELAKNYKELLINNGLLMDNEVEEKEQKAKITGAYNKIYYGTPGCGKSYHVKTKYETSNNLVFRTTFFPDYSNSDFIGQILPKLDNDSQVIYEFVPGVLSNALKTALENPSEKVVLIIEEINRGNAAAIFGDVFQLLDRDFDGNSLYKIKIPAVTEWLETQEIYQDDIILPSNLYIVATMNTSDQNVFTLDTAFKRRWDMVAVPNDFSSKLEWFDYYIPGSNYTWKSFVKTVNQFILENNIMSLNNEDKRLGVYFIGKNELSETPLNNDETLLKSFANKVLMYLWEDVAKMNRDEWFDSDILSLDQLIDKFAEETNDDSLKVFAFYENKQ